MWNNFQSTLDEKASGRTMQIYLLSVIKLYAYKNAFLLYTSAYRKKYPRNYLHWLPPGSVMGRMCAMYTMIELVKIMNSENNKSLI